MDDTLLIVTGASRGLGRAIGVAFASSPSTKRLFCLLVARSENGLEETASLMREAAAAAENNSKLDISCMVADLSDMDTLEKKVEDVFQRATKEGSCTYDRAILINNAGSLGCLGKCSEMSSLADLKKAVDFNVTSSSWVSSQFVRKFSSSSSSENGKGTCIVVVNISSLCAIEPFSTMSTYCAGKAARDLFHSVLAKESSADVAVNVRVLNYAPGMCETAMSEELAESDRLDSELSSMYRTALSDKTMVQPKDTSEKLVEIIHRNEWENGKHIDFWDE